MPPRPPVDALRNSLDLNRQARYYRITPAGRRALGKEVESWKKFAAALDAVLRTT